MTRLFGHGVGPRAADAKGSHLSGRCLEGLQQGQPPGFVLGRCGQDHLQGGDGDLLLGHAGRHICHPKLHRMRQGWPLCRHLQLPRARQHQPTRLSPPLPLLSGHARPQAGTGPSMREACAMPAAWICACTQAGSSSGVHPHRVAAHQAGTVPAHQANRTNKSVRRRANSTRCSQAQTRC